VEETVTFMAPEPISGLGLRPITLADRAAFAAYFQSLAEPLSDYTFSQLYTWRNSLRIYWRELEDHLCVFANGTGDLTLLMPPIGEGGSRGDHALASAFEVMDAYNLAHNVPDRSRVEYVSEELLSRFERAGLTISPMGTDYVYDTARMIDLAGGDLASKRQARNRFTRNYRYRVETYSAQKHLADCRRLLDSWKIHQDAQHLEEPNASAIKRQKETLAAELSLEAAEELGLRGMVVYVQDGPEQVLKGFTLGEWLGKDQSSITVEKTELEVKGLAQFIFSEFCRVEWSGRPYVNVGDDWGLESLAWTKMSYRPVKLLQKYAMRRVAPVRVAVGAPEPAAASQPEAVVRVAQKKDLEAAVELEQRCFTAHSLTKRQLQYLQRTPSATFLVAERDGRVVGEGIFLVRRNGKRPAAGAQAAPPSGRIYSLAVAEDCRGQKIGWRLLRAMLEGLAALNVRRVYLEVEEANERATAMYRRNGFRPIGTLPDYYGPGKHGLHMMCELPAPAEVAAGAQLASV
jgi:ribosomal protein S18 acetylase RimI-like enzyme